MQTKMLRFGPRPVLSSFPPLPLPLPLPLACDILDPPTPSTPTPTYSAYLPTPPYTPTYTPHPQPPQAARRIGTSSKDANVPHLPA